MMSCSTADAEELSPVEKDRHGCITAEERGMVKNPESLDSCLHISCIEITAFKKIPHHKLSGIQVQDIKP